MVHQIWKEEILALGYGSLTRLKSSLSDEIAELADRLELTQTLIDEWEETK